MTIIGRLCYQLRSKQLSTSKQLISRPQVRNMSIRLFEDKDHANLYATYRPTYSESIYENIFKFMQEGGGTCGYDLAVDVGCGNGQSCRPLCERFSRVIGYDVSKQQVNSAKRDLENLTFKVGPGENLNFLEDNSTDLITSAQALHWLDRDAFYKEVRRVLKPGGVFAAYGYGVNVLDDKPANSAMLKFYKDLLGPYWDKQRSLIETHYTTIDIPFKDQKRLMDEDLCIRREMPLDAYIGYLSTWSAWRAYCKQHPDTPALEDLKKILQGCYGNRNIKVVWPEFLLLGRKPSLK